MFITDFHFEIISEAATLLRQIYDCSCTFSNDASKVWTILTLLASTILAAAQTQFN